MRTLALILLALATTFSAPALAQYDSGNAGCCNADDLVQGQPWYEKDEKPTSLKTALAAEKELLGIDNIGWRMTVDKNICAALRKVKLSCDYDTRVTLSLFLTVNNKGLFTEGGRPNKDFVDPYMGTAEQNALLSVAVARNAKLFKDGDLTVEALKNWK